MQVKGKKELNAALSPLRPCPVYPCPSRPPAGVPTDHFSPRIPCLCPTGVSMTLSLNVILSDLQLV